MLYFYECINLYVNLVNQMYVHAFQCINVSRPIELLTQATWQQTTVGVGGRPWWLCFSGSFPG